MELIPMEILNKHVLFRNLETRSKHLLLKGASIGRYKKDSYIYEEGEDCSKMYLLIEGTVVITKERDGRDVIKRIVFTNELFSLYGVYNSSINSEGAKVVGGNAVVLMIDNVIVKELVKMDSLFSEQLLKETFSNLKRIEKRLDSFMFKDAKERIIDFIKVNAEKSGIKVGYETLVKHEFTQQNIAEYTGTTRQTVTTILKDLKKKNIITFQRKRILIRDLATL